MSLCHLLGQMCSALLTTHPHKVEKLKDSDPQQQKNELLVHSDLWKTLFRGGYLVGKLTRSLSGAYVSERVFGGEVHMLSLCM